jgi:hypothetical protein
LRWQQCVRLFPGGRRFWHATSGVKQHVSLDGNKALPYLHFNPGTGEKRKIQGGIERRGRVSESESEGESESERE